MLLCVWALMPTPSAFADAPDEVDVDRVRYLRQVTLDLWGRVPTEAEGAALVDAADVDEGAVQAMLDDPQAMNFVRRHHRDLLWPRIENTDLLNVAIAFLLPAIIYEDSGDPFRLYLLYPALYQRGGLVPCKDEPAELDAEGNLIFEDMPDGTKREGYVMVEPYWAPGTEVKVCGLEARLDPFAADGQACNTIGGMFTGTCGCGPKLQYCLSPTSAAVVEESLREQLLRMLEKPIKEGTSYFDALLTTTEELNGPLIHYYRYLVAMALDPIIQVPPVPIAALPVDVPFTDMSWQPYQRTPEHSGVLTSLSFLLRFQTARARANRFYNAFLCAPLEAPEVELPSPNDACSDEPDLRYRCGCQYCHATLEPAAAHWARFADAGSMYLSPLTFPSTRQDCAKCAENPGGACDYICQRFYLTEAGHPKEEPYVGSLKSLVFRPDSELKAVTAGPRRLVNEQLESGAMGRCVVRNLFTRLYKREMTETERLELLPRLADGFFQSGYDFKALVLSLLTEPTYRRMSR